MEKSSVSFKLISWIKSKSMGCVILILVIIYCMISILFGLIYYGLAKNDQFTVIELVDEQIEKNTTEKGLEETKPQVRIADYIYFSFITASTIGYGDYYPTAIIGRILVVIQSVFCAVYVAIMMSIITSKLLWPAKNTIIFSKKVLYNPKENYFQVRIINTNSMPIINPEIKVAMTEHGRGDIIAGIMELDNSCAKPLYLGRHDFIITFGVRILNSNPDSSEADIICGELLKAIAYQTQAKKDDSRFRITITISGSNEVQNIAAIKKYYATDFVIGQGFKAIKYEEKDTDKLGMNYKKIPNFWTQFESIKNESPLISFPTPEKTCTDHV